MSSPSDWVQFYADRASDATTVTTTVNSSSSAGPLSPDGRVSKPIRRRSRASRRTPTTLLNTDTTNFRAMVQQFTGGHSAPFSSVSNFNPAGGAPNISFGIGSHPGGVMVPHRYHLQYQQQQQQQQQPLFQQNMFSGDGFLQRLGNNTRPNNNLGISGDGFGVSAQLGSMLPTAAPPSGNEKRNNHSYMF